MIYLDTLNSILMRNSLFRHILRVTVKVWNTICKPTLVANQKLEIRNKFWSDFTVFEKCISL